MNKNHNPSVDPATLSKMFHGDKITAHQENAKTYLTLMLIFGGIGAFSTIATALSKQRDDGADFILGTISGLLITAAINMGVLYKKQKSKIAKLQKQAHQHIR